MRFQRRTKTLAAAVLLALSPMASAFCPLDGAKPFTAGPVNPANGFASYVQDSQGLALELCLTGDGDRHLLLRSRPFPTISFPWTVGFGAEAFWWLSDNAFTNASVGWVVVMAAEAAWAAEVPGAGEQFPFTRLRIRIDTVQPGIYTMTHPYGQDTFTVTTVGAGFDVREVFDIPFAPAAQGQGRVAPWLKSVGAPFTDPPAPGQRDPFIGNGTPLPVTGSPCGNNFVRVSATALNGVTPLLLDAGDADGDGSDLTVTQSNFTVRGQVYAGNVNTPLAVNGATFSRDATGAGLLNVFATAPTDATVSTAGAIATTDGQGRFFASQTLAAAAPTPATVDVTATATAADLTRANNLPNTVAAVPVVDVVSITSAQATCSGGPAAPVCSLTVTAASSDVSGAPVLTATGFGDLAAGSLTVPNLSVLPATVTVTSATGGSDTEPVRILNQ